MYSDGSPLSDVDSSQPSTTEPTNEEKFKRIINRESVDKVVFAVFSCEGCHPCKKYKEIIKSFLTEYGTRAFAIGIDAIQHHAIAKKYQVRTVPTTVIFRNSDVMETKTGIITGRSLKKMLGKFG